MHDDSPTGQEIHLYANEGKLSQEVPVDIVLEELEFRYSSADVVTSTMVAVHVSVWSYSTPQLGALLRG